MTLRWRIAAVMATMCTTVAALGALGAYIATSNQLATQLDRDLTTRIRPIALGPDTANNSDGGGPNGGSLGDQHLACPPAPVFGPVDAAQLTKPDGTILVCITTGPALPPATVVGAPATEQLSTSRIDGANYRIAASPFHDGGTIQVALSTAPDVAVLAALERKLILLALGSALLGGLAGWILATRLVAPVERMRRAARTIASTQDLTIPVPVDGPAELRDLGRDIATMVEALAASRSQQHRLVTDASHEFRTPLTSLTTNLELLERFDEIPENERPEIITALRADVDDLTHLARDLVELATDRSTDEEPVETTLVELVQPVITRARRRSGRDIQLDDHTDAASINSMVHVRPQMIQRAASNLVENAIKYAPNGVILVRVGATSIEVLDSGPGIDPADSDQIFERFWRSDTARGLPGSGLGLSIVAQIATQHGGNTWAHRRVEGGTAVGFRVRMDVQPGDG